MPDRIKIEVDVIIPVHNASSTVEETVLSALNQEIPSSPSQLLQSFLQKHVVSTTVCCYDDGSTDDSLQILREIESSRSAKDVVTSALDGMIPSKLLIGSGDTKVGRGAGYARNRAIELNNAPLRDKTNTNGEGSNSTGKSGSTEDDNRLKFLCLLDSDDIMHKHRIIEQTLFMMYRVDKESRDRTILGGTFDRDPPDSTWHYSSWANNLTEERLILERYREITILQPTWFMQLAVWSNVGGYIEAPPLGSSDTASDVLSQYVASGLSSSNASYLIHPKYDSLSSLKLAEDLRFFHSHLQLNGCLRVHRTALATSGKEVLPLVTYRHVENAQSQSFRTSRKLLLQLRALAFQKSIIRTHPSWNTQDKHFVIWGCGRDGKDFFKALDPDVQERVYCFVDVDAKKLNAGYYVDTTAHRDAIKESKEAKGLDKRDKKRKQKTAARKIPVVHFSFLIPNQQEQESIRSEYIADLTTGKNSGVGNIDKSKNGVVDSSSDTFQQKMKKQKLNSTVGAPVQLQDRGLDPKVLSWIPVVVCVAMYRTNGVLERNVGKIGRTEGKDLWHFS